LLIELVLFGAATAACALLAPSAAAAFAVVVAAHLTITFRTSDRLPHAARR
jgi:hypothetical protein